MLAPKAKEAALAITMSNTMAKTKTVDKATQTEISVDDQWRAIEDHMKKKGWDQRKHLLDYQIRSVILMLLRNRSFILKNVGGKHEFISTTYLRAMHHRKLLLLHPPQFTDYVLPGRGEESARYWFNNKVKYRAIVIKNLITWEKFVYEAILAYKVSVFASLPSRLSYDVKYYIYKYLD